MLSYTVAVQLLLGVAGLTQAQSPPNIFPQVNNNLVVQFSGQQINPGVTLPSQVAQSTPTLGIQMNQINGNTNQRYLMLMVDLDTTSSGNTRKKRADAAPAAPQQTNAPQAPAAPQQPDDPEHSGGRDTFLHCLIQDYQLTGGQNLGNGATQLQSGTNGPVGWQAPNPNSGSHRYMFLLFEQPDGFQVPSSLQGMVQGRQNFDMRQFIQQANLPLPRWGNYFVVQNGNSAGSSFGGNGFSASTYFTASTGVVTVPGIGGGLSLSTATSSYLTTQSFGNFQGGQTPSITTYTTATTFPNGGPTQTFLTVSTAFVNGGQSFGGQSLTTYTTSTTFPNGGPTQTYLTTSTLFGAAQSNGQFTSVFLTTTTFPNNGPTETFLTTSTGFGFNSVGFNSYPSGLQFSTGFSGLRTSTSTGPTTFSTATTLPNGQISSYQTASSTTATITFSGVSAISRTTFSTTSTGTTTGTNFLNGQLSTYTSTFTSSGLTTFTQPAFATAGAGRNVVVVDNLVEKALVGLLGAVLAYL